MMEGKCLACGASDHTAAACTAEWPDSASLTCGNCQATLRVTALGATKTTGPPRQTAKASGGGVATCKCSSEGREGVFSWLRLGAAVAGKIAEMQRRQKGEEGKEVEERGDSAVHLSQMHGEAIEIFDGHGYQGHSQTTILTI